MTDKDLGTATIVYEDPEDGTIEQTIQNEHIAYFQDHWILKRDEGEEGNDRVRRIPSQRVYYVDRNVEEFEDEVRTVRTQVENVASDLRSKILGGDGEEETSSGSSSPVEIEVTDERENDDDDTDDGGISTER